MLVKKHILTETSYLETTLPQDVFQVINDEVLEMERNNFKYAEPFNTRLIGAIEHEFRLVKSLPKIESYFQTLFRHNTSYFEGKIPRFGKIVDENGSREHNVWVNFQKKYEYNPPHCHNGDISFVTWLRIPYDLNEEKTVPNLKKLDFHNVSKFVFIYPDVTPNVSKQGHIGSTSLLIDKSWVGKCIFFPSHLIHSVTPFYTSDDYRISVSGNFVLE